MSRYRFIAAEKAAVHNVAKACALLEVSRSAYYQWSQQRPSAHARRDSELVDLDWSAPVEGLEGDALSKPAESKRRSRAR